MKNEGIMNYDYNIFISPVNIFVSYILLKLKQEEVL